MESTSLHPLLTSQIAEILGSTTVGDNLGPLLQRISETYVASDKAKQELMLEVEYRTEQLVASTSSAYSFLDSLHMGLVMCDVNPEVVFTNTSAKSMLTADDALNSGGWTLDAVAELLQPKFQLKEVIKKSLSDNASQEYKEVGFGNRVLRLFVAPMTTTISHNEVQQIGAVVLIEDTTEQVVSERSKDEFFSIASHELRTPLTAIRGNASLIKTYYGAHLPDPSIIEMVDDIHASAVRLIEIVNDFLDVSALEQGKILMEPKAIQPAEVVDEVIHETQSLALAKKISLVVDPSIAALPLVIVDRRRLKQVIYNLVGNAIKFTDVGSVTLRGGSDGAMVRIDVTDTGPGMPIENQRLLFRKFQQTNTSLLTRDATQGTGLGLYISKLIVELSGGKIWLDKSEVDKGTTFAFSLPCA